MSSINDAAALQTTVEEEEKRTRSGLRRAVAPIAPPPPEHIPGLPTPQELQLAAQQRISPLSPVVVVRNVPSTPRPFLPPQSVRRAFISQMQSDAPPRPSSVWPWLVVAFFLSAVGIALGLFGLGLLPLPR